MKKNQLFSNFDVMTNDELKRIKGGYVIDDDSTTPKKAQTPPPTQYPAQTPPPTQQPN